MSFSNMDVIWNERDVKIAWENRENVMSIAKSQKRPLTMQLRELAQRARKTSFRGPESPLYIATCPYFYIACVFGLGPYDFDDELLVPSNLYVIFAIIWICLYTYLVYCILLDFTYASSENREILRFTEISKVLINYGVVIFDLLSCTISRNGVTEVWNGIQDYDEILHDLGYIRNERNTKIWVWSSLAVATTIYTLVNQTGIYAFQQSWVTNISYLIVYIGSAVTIMKFSGLVMIVAQRFNQLNEISLECTSRQSKKIIGTSRVNINTIETLHHHMLSVAENLNSAYSWSIMLWLMNLCVHSVTNLYFLSSWILQSDIYTGLICCILSWILSFHSQLFILNFVCHYAASKANCFNWIVLEWKRQVIKYNKKMGIEISCTPLTRELHFSAAGCFNVDLPLLSVIASSLTTYLFILLQFD